MLSAIPTIGHELTFRQGLSSKTLQWGMTHLHVIIQGQIDYPRLTPGVIDQGPPLV